MSIHRFLYGTFVGVIALFSVVFLASAFVGPSQSPPLGYGAVVSDAGNRLAIGTSTISPTTRLFLVASSSLSTDYVLRVARSNGTALFDVRNDGNICLSGSCITSWSSIGGGIGGSGTGVTSRIPLWTNSSTIGNSQIYDNGTNIGIANTNPAYRLDVTGDVNVRSGSVFRHNGVAGISTTCTGGQVLGNVVVSGGIITGGSCTSTGAVYQ